MGRAVPAASRESGRVVVAARTPGEQKPALSLSPLFFFFDTHRQGLEAQVRQGLGRRVVHPVRQLGEDAVHVLEDGAQEDHPPLGAQDAELKEEGRGGRGGGGEVEAGKREKKKPTPAASSPPAAPFFQAPHLHLGLRRDAQAQGAGLGSKGGGSDARPAAGGGRRVAHCNICKK